jgi:hypothetical protein
MRRSNPTATASSILPPGDINPLRSVGVDSTRCCGWTSLCVLSKSVANGSDVYDGRSPSPWSAVVGKPAKTLERQTSNRQASASQFYQDLHIPLFTGVARRVSPALIDEAHVASLQFKLPRRRVHLRRVDDFQR